MNEMEALRIDEELRKQKVPQNPVNVNRYSKDSGVVDIELLKLSDGSGGHRLSAPECERLKKTTLSNSLIDISEGSRVCFSSYCYIVHSFRCKILLNFTYLFAEFCSLLCVNRPNFAALCAIYNC